MNFKLLLLSSAISLLLTGCASGGGGGGNQTPAPTPVPTDPPVISGPIRRGTYFGYFGADDLQLGETADHTNLLFEASWGDWSSEEGRQAILDRYVLRLQTAKQLGITKAILTIDFLLFEPFVQNHRILLPEADLRNRIRWFFQRLRDENLLENIFALYPIDEPNAFDISPASLDLLIAIVGGIARTQFEFDPDFAVIYASGHNSNFVSIDKFRYVGFDHYEEGAGILGLTFDMVKAQIRSDQFILLIPGGAEPWMTWPDEFFNKLQADETVIGIVPFVWFDNYGWSGKKGIRSNGLAVRYKAFGKAVKENF